MKFSNSQSKTSISRFLELTLGTKWITSCERACKTAPKNDVGVCVHFCLRPLVPLERCADTCQNNLSDLFDVSDIYFYSSPRTQWNGSTRTRTKARGLSLSRGKMTDNTCGTQTQLHCPTQQHKPLRLTTTGKSIRLHHK